MKFCARRSEEGGGGGGGGVREWEGKKPNTPPPPPPHPQHPRLSPHQQTESFVKSRLSICCFEARSNLDLTLDAGDGRCRITEVCHHHQFMAITLNYTGPCAMIGILSHEN